MSRVQTLVPGRLSNIITLSRNCPRKRRDLRTPSQHEQVFSVASVSQLTDLFSKEIYAVCLSVNEIFYFVFFLLWLPVLFLTQHIEKFCNFNTLAEAPDEGGCGCPKKVLASPKILLKFSPVSTTRTQLINVLPVLNCK